MISNELKTLIDFIIGDGHIGYYNRSYHCKLTHSTKQKEYLLHKVSRLESFGFTGHLFESKKVLNGKEFSIIEYAMHINPYIKSAYKWIVNSGRKSIDKHLLSVLDAETLAYWFMDDGTASKTNKSSSSPGNGYRYYYTYPIPKLCNFSLYTYGFTFEENNLIIDWAKEKLGLKFNLVSSKRDGIYLKISELEQRKLFIETIKPFIVPSMEYKITGLLSYKDIKPIDVCRKRLNEEAPLGDNTEDDATVQGV